MWRNRFKVRVMREGDGGVPTPPGGPTPKAPETFTREYVHELREENKAIRLKLQEATAAATKAKEEADATVAKVKEESETVVTGAKKAANDRIIRAELKAAAVKEGLIDLDDLTLVDITTIVIKDDGTLEGADKVIEAFKTAKPHKFGKPSTSNQDPPPKKPGADDNPKSAKEMTKEEYDKEKRKLLNQ